MFVKRLLENLKSNSSKNRVGSVLLYVASPDEESGSFHCNQVYNTVAFTTMRVLLAQAQVFSPDCNENTFVQLSVAKAQKIVMESGSKP